MAVGPAEVVASCPWHSPSQRLSRPQASHPTALRRCCEGCARRSPPWLTCPPVKVEASPEPPQAPAKHLRPQQEPRHHYRRDHPDVSELDPPAEQQAALRCYPSICAGSCSGFLESLQRPAKIAKGAPHPIFAAMLLHVCLDLWSGHDASLERCCEVHRAALHGVPHGAALDCHLQRCGGHLSYVHDRGRDHGRDPGHVPAPGHDFALCQRHDGVLAHG
mmetsp:Transcript_33174/g.87749  ORF Transcript_33174/g.87749 Transcript_33174/m.87749 type:complete len:219 (+) Transcript_33174:368-1024(+)